MSATGRSDVRHPDDYYATPSWCTRAILPHLAIGALVLDPCAGDGAILDVIAHEYPLSNRRGFEINIDRAQSARAKCLIVEQRDALRPEPWGDASFPPTCVITNPPYSLAMAFVDRSLREVAKCGTVAMLLRLNWLASAKRADWHRAHPCDVYVLPRRPSFTGKGTDATEYAWLVWPPGGPQRRGVTILEVTP